MDIKKQKAVLIGIGGVSRSGKTTLALSLGQWLTEQGQTVTLVHQDDCVKPTHLLPKIRHRFDWECPESIDFELFKAKIATAQDTASVVIAEGLLAFYEPELRYLYDYRVFIDLSKSAFLARKQADTRWGFEPKWYIEHIWNSHIRYGRTLLDDSQATFLHLSRDKIWDKSILKSYFAALF